MTSFGGIHLVHEEIIGSKLIALINDHMQSRHANATFSFADLVLNTSYIALCGGDCAEDIHVLGDTFNHLRGMKVQSADTLLRMQKELSSELEVLYSKDGVENQLNYNEQLNALMLKIALHVDQLSKDKTDYTLDFDHQFIPTEKYDSKYSYKNKRGYFPGVASINNIPVYLENRNGNSHVSFNQLDTIRRIAHTLSAAGIQPARYRMDSGSYIKKVTDYIHKQLGASFYIRADQCNRLLHQAANCVEDWQDCKIGLQQYEVNSFDYEFGSHVHRIVAYRRPNKSGQQNIFTADANRYLFIITNDRDWDEKTIIEFYNQRGDSERLFDIQNNDFNWRKLPFGDLQFNTVYLHLMAICHILYKWLIQRFCQTIRMLKSTSRLKKFIFHLICIPAKIIRSGRQKIVKLFIGDQYGKVDFNTS